MKDLVYEIVRNIPSGKVMTYGAIAKIATEKIKKLRTKEDKIKIINPRYIGYLLHNNPDPEKIPCHRVVNGKGKVADNYKFGGWKEQKRKLLEEGVEFKDERYVDKKYFFFLVL